MGEITDMKMDGTLCEGCGAFIGDEVGYPRYDTAECYRDAFPKKSYKEARAYLKGERINKHGEGPRTEYEKVNTGGEG